MLDTGWYANQGIVGDLWVSPVGDAKAVAQENSKALLDVPEGLRVILVADVLSGRWPWLILDMYRYGPLVEEVRRWFITYFLALKSFGVYPDGLFADDETAPDIWAVLASGNIQTSMTLLQAILDDPFARLALPAELQDNGVRAQDVLAPGYWDPNNPSSYLVRKFNENAVRLQCSLLKVVLFEPFQTVFGVAVPCGNWDMVNLRSPFLDKNGWPLVDLPINVSMPAVYLWADGKLFYAPGRVKLPIWNAAIWCTNYMRVVDRARSVPWFSYLGFAGDAPQAPVVRKQAVILERFLLRAANRFGYKRIGIWNPPNTTADPNADADLQRLLTSLPKPRPLPSAALFPTPFDVDIIAVDDVQIHYSEIL